MTDQLYLPDLGTQYQNPVLFCDYSDPDVIRVGDTYYLTASSFNYVPGLPILVSKDLVNWTLVNYAVRNIPSARFAQPRHAAGIWAPAIRWHDGFFYIFFGMPDEGIYMVRTRDALGTWEEPVLVLAGKGLIDPCPFWDEDGTAWVIHGYAKSRIGFKSWLGIFSMSSDATHAIGPDHLLYDGTQNHPTIEGPKVYQRNGWYYIFAPAGGVETGWQTVLRSKNLFGPYEDRIVLRQGNSPINGPHQGGWVETPDGDHWFLHFQSRGVYGRVVHLQPMTWQADGWPVIGQPEEDNPTCGTPVTIWPKPQNLPGERLSLQASDDFQHSLGLQWQFMANWDSSFYEVDAGRLRLFVHPQQQEAPKLWDCPQVLTQKIICPAFTAEVTLDAHGLKVGEQAGFGMIGGQYAFMALRREKTELKLIYVQSSGEDHTEQMLEQKAISAESIRLRMALKQTGDAEAEVAWFYDDGTAFQPIGHSFVPARHTWVGARIALFAMSYQKNLSEGFADFSAFEVKTR